MALSKDEKKQDKAKLELPKKEVGTTTQITPPIVPQQRQLTQHELAINKFQTQLASYEKLILPPLLKKHGIEPDQFVKIVISEIKRNNKLLEAFMVNPASMYASILAGAEIGLMPSEMTGEFFLIPRNLKQADGSYKQTVTGMLGYKGLVNILLRSGDVKKIHTEVVYKGDIFDVTYGLEPDIKHIPNFNTERTADNITHAYAVAKIKNEEFQFAVMTRKEIQAIVDLPQYKNRLYFNDKEGSNRWMEKKAVLIQLAKMLPKDYYSTRALSFDNNIEGGGYLTLDDSNQIKIISPTSVNRNNKGGWYGTKNMDLEPPQE